MYAPRRAPARRGTIRNPAAYAAAVARNAAPAARTYRPRALSAPVARTYRPRAPARAVPRARRAPRIPRARGTGGSVLAALMGKGTYTVNKNTLVHPSQAEQIPAFGNVAGGTRVRHREFIQDVTGTIAFTNHNFPINPGNGDVFPWLASTAKNYEQYKINGMIFEFVSTSASALNSTNTALGTVILSTQYNSLAPSFTNKQQMENNVYTVSCKPAESVMHPIECEPAQTSVPILYTYSGSIPPSGDVRLYNAGNFQLATVGMQAEAVIGELHVTYDITFYKPQLDQGLAQDSATALYNLYGLGAGGAGITAAYPLGDPALAPIKWFDSIGLTMDKSTGEVILPIGMSGVYMLQYGIIGQYTAMQDKPTLTYTNIDETESFPFFGAANPFSINADTDAEMCVTVIFRIVDPNLPAIVTIDFQGAAVPPGISNSGYVFVQQMNGDFPSQSTEPFPTLAAAAPLKAVKAPKALKKEAPVSAAAGGPTIPPTPQYAALNDDEEKDDSGEELEVVPAVQNRRRSVPKNPSTSLLNRALGRA